MTIQLLQPEVAAKIAAGEVVERPANAVKELVENSLDAGATEVRVELRDGGQRLLRVSDNGLGIPAAEASLAFQRHATSKLTTADDLNHIDTFGFRGEALYSIAAVSQLSLTTRSRDEEFGVQLRLEGGQVVSQSRAGAPAGTVVTVEHLFYNLPARRKFQRKPAADAGQVAGVVEAYALAHPERRFSLIVDGRTVFQTSGNGELFDVLAQVYGLENARQMTPIGAEPAPGSPDLGPNSLTDGPHADVEFMTAAELGQPASDTVRIGGYTSLPSLTRANRSHISLFVNRRWIEDRNLAYAVVQAYHAILPVGRYPITLLFLEVDPTRLDVNIHPQKTQVRFLDERRLFGRVQRAVRRAVLDASPVPGLALAVPVPLVDSPAQTARQSWRAEWSETSVSPVQIGEQTEATAPGEGAPLPALPAAPPSPPSSSATAPARQAALDERPQRLPPLRVVGQVGAMYIVAEGPEGLFLIDQHAAHERILYEQFMAQRYGVGGSQVARQHLLQPLTLHVGSAAAGLVAAHQEQLDGLGFEVEPFGGDTFLVRAVPAALAGEDPMRSLEEIVQALQEGRNLVGEELEGRLVRMVCKRAAIKGGQLLSDLEMQELLYQLGECQSPRTCPHGRPTMIQLSAGELEKAFGRI